MRRVLGLAAAAACVAGAAVLQVWPTGTASPTPSAPAIDWNPDAANGDWPGPLRDEQPGGAALLLRIPDVPDALGDAGASTPWLDITHVTLRTGNTVNFSNPIGLEVGGGLAPVPEPSVAWIAYGVVVDLDGDGRPEQRIGVDNSSRDHREWITDLATGRAESNVSGTFGGFGAFGTKIETWFVDRSGLVGLHVKRRPGGIRFYAWASMVRDGRIVATDFAPDTGWIETVGP